MEMVDTISDLEQNPLGSILDYKEGSRGEAERSYNVEFEAKSQLTEYGYDVELKIPFSSLNYPEKKLINGRFYLKENFITKELSQDTQAIRL